MRHDRPPQRLSTIIIGAGFSGIAVAIALRHRGIDDFLILEKAADLGGTWRENVYPGCACDVQSHLYSYSFAPNPDWNRTFAGGTEIQHYLQDCARRFGVVPRIRFNHRFQAARFDEERGAWHITTTEDEYIADNLVLAQGPLHNPRLPDVPGMDSFRGTTFHSATWDHDYPLEGKRVAVIGTGASAIQFVPHIARRVDRLVLIQRTPPWILPRGDREYRTLEKRLFAAVPPWRAWYRRYIYWHNEWRALGMLNPALMKPIEGIARRHITRSIDDPALAEAVTPDFRIGCKRILLSNDYYPTLARDNVSLHTSGLARVTGRHVVTADGRRHEVDAIIYGTGFNVTNGYDDMEITGRDGVRLADTWSRGPHAYLGTTVAGFPNLFLMLGPNTGLAHNSMIFMAEAQTRYIMEALRLRRRYGARYLEVRREVQEAYNESLRSRLSTTIWQTGGCHSWYVDPDGTNRTLWPGYTFDYWWRTRRIRPRDYVLTV